MLWLDGRGAFVASTSPLTKLQRFYYKGVVSLERGKGIGLSVRGGTEVARMVRTGKAKTLPGMVAFFLLGALAARFPKPP